MFKAYFSVVGSFGLEDLWEKIESLDNKVPFQTQMTALVYVYQILARTVPWLLRYYPIAKTIEETISLLSIGISSFLNSLPDTVDPETQGRIEQEIKNLCDQQVPQILPSAL